MNWAKLNTFTCPHCNKPWIFGTTRLNRIDVGKREWRRCHFGLVESARSPNTTQIGAGV